MLLAVQEPCIFVFQVQQLMSNLASLARTLFLSPGHDFLCLSCFYFLTNRMTLVLYHITYNTHSHKEHMNVKTEELMHWAGMHGPASHLFVFFIWLNTTLCVPRPCKSLGSFYNKAWIMSFELTSEDKWLLYENVCFLYIIRVLVRSWVSMPLLCFFHFTWWWWC